MSSGTLNSTHSLTPSLPHNLCDSGLGRNSFSYALETFLFSTYHTSAFNALKVLQRCILQSYLFASHLHPVLSCAAASIFLQLYLKPVVHISFSRYLFHVFFGSFFCGLVVSTVMLVWLAMLSSLFLSMSKPVPLSYYSSWSRFPWFKN